MTRFLAVEISTLIHPEGNQGYWEARSSNKAAYIGKALSRYEKDPLKFAEKLTDSKLGAYRFRVGDFRVVFDLHENEIVVLRVGHRSEIYRA